MSFFHLPMMMPQETQNISIPKKATVPVAGNPELIKKLKLYDNAQNFPELKDWSVHVVPINLFKQLTQTYDVIHHMTGDNRLPRAFSILGSNMTFINQDYLDKMNDQEALQLLAHEYGHLSQKTQDETQADKWADSYIKALKKKK